MGKLLKTEAVSEMTTIPVGTLVNWRMSGKGPRFGKLGRRVFYREEDVHAWIDASFADTPTVEAV